MCVFVCASNPLESRENYCVLLLVVCFIVESIYCYIVFYKFYYFDTSFSFLWHHRCVTHLYCIPNCIDHLPKLIFQLSIINFQFFTFSSLTFHFQFSTFNYLIVVLRWHHRLRFLCCRFCLFWLRLIFCCCFIYWFGYSRF